MMSKYKTVPMETSWICSKCNTAVRNYIIQNITTMQESLHVLKVDTDPVMIHLRETVGMEEASLSDIQNCKHDRFFKEFCSKWRTLNERIFFVSKLIGIRLLETDGCLEEWDRLTAENDEAVIDGEHKFPTVEKIHEFIQKYKGILYNIGQRGIDDFKTDMSLMKMEQNRLIGNIPYIKRNISNLPKASQECMLKIIKTHSDRFEAKNIITRPGELTITILYNELKVACEKANMKKQMEQDIQTTSQKDEHDKPTTTQEDKQYNIIILPTEETNQTKNEERAMSPTLAKFLVDLQGERPKIPNIIIPGVRKARTKEAIILSEENDLIVDVACVLKLFKAMNSVPKPFEVRLPSPPLGYPSGSSRGCCSPLQPLSIDGKATAEEINEFIRIIDRKRAAKPDRKYQLAIEKHKKMVRERYGDAEATDPESGSGED